MTWKAVKMKADDSVELYDLENDIGEKNNIASEHPDLVDKLAGIMKEAHTQNKEERMQQRDIINSIKEKLIFHP